MAHCAYNDDIQSNDCKSSNDDDNTLQIIQKDEELNIQLQNNISTYLSNLNLEFNCDSSENSDQPLSLQEAFEKFRKNKISLIKKKRINKNIQIQRTPGQKILLRNKFINQCKKYLGVPYAKRYHIKDSSYYNAPLFLDCCGLIRRVLLDLKGNFGFHVGHWNQSYLFDTLRKKYSSYELMQPGDLVFISATYYNPKSRKQRHDMVHVEVWLGDGIKTIGARWQTGVVNIFDSYAFTSKSYFNMQYHFCSINTWLEGICKSWCKIHKWTRSSFNRNKRSIFAVENDDSNQSVDLKEEIQ